MFPHGSRRFSDSRRAIRIRHPRLVAAAADPRRADSSVRSAGLEFALLDPQWLRELRLVVSDLLDEALGVLAPEKDIDCVAERATVPRACRR